MNILIFGLNFHPELIGVGKYTGEMAQALIDHGHRVTVITAPPYYPAWKITDGYSRWWYRTEKKGSLKIIRCPLWVPTHVTNATRLLHLASFCFSSLFTVPTSIYPAPDIVISIAPTLLAAPAALLAGRLTGAPTWLHIQDFELDAALGLGILRKNTMIRDLAQLFEKWVLSSFEYYSSISQSMVNRLTDLGVPSEKVFLFPNWVDTDSIHPLDAPNIFREQLGLGNNDVVVLYSGSMGVKQGLEVVIKSARELRAKANIQFVLCGDGPARQELHTSSYDCPNVHFLPLQPDDKFNELLNMADIHVLPQKSGASDLVMPSKLPGMLASGKPVIASCEEGSQLKTIIKSTGIPVASEDSAALSQSILQLAEDPGLRAQLGEQGRRFVIENYSKKKILERFISVLEGIPSRTKR